MTKKSKVLIEGRLHMDDGALVLEPPEYRNITINYLGASYPGVAAGDTFVGLKCRLPRMIPELWTKAVEEALAR